jgi:Uma2 family endonuclease
MPARGNLTAMNIPIRKSWTQGEFFTWAASQEGRFEFDGFRPVAMTGGTAGLSVIMQNVHAALRGRLRGSGCRPLGPDAGVATTGTAVRYPDALVTCSPFDRDAMTIPGVVVVIEVVSASSSRTDRILKVREYAAVPSIRRYIIVESTTAGLTVMEREGPDEVWRVATLTSDDILRLPEIGIEIPVAEFYVDIDFENEAAAGP